LIKQKEAKKINEEKTKRRKELDRKRRREAKTMHQKKRKPIEGQERGKSKDKYSNSRDTATASDDHIKNEELGEVEPNLGTVNDINIQSEIIPESSKNISATVDNTDKGSEKTNEEIIKEVKKQLNMAKPRYTNLYDDDEGEDYDIDDYEDDFDIENPTDGKILNLIQIVQVDVCRGVHAQKHNKEEVKGDNKNNQKHSQDQGGKVADSNPDYELPKDDHEENNVATSVKESPAESPSTKFVQNKFNSNSTPKNDNLDGSTVVIADVTPSQIDISAYVPPSPMIDQATKDKLKVLGQSLDSKQINQAIGSIDMRRLCK